MSHDKKQQALFQQISGLITHNHQQAQCRINSTMVQTCWKIGQWIVKHEKQSEPPANNRKPPLAPLAKQLTQHFGKGFDTDNLRNMRKFYLTYPRQSAVRPELSWPHYRALLRIENPEAREWYAKETVTQSWSTRILELQISLQYYERQQSHPDTETTEPNEQLVALQKEYPRDASVLDFLHPEDDSEQAIELRREIVSDPQRFIVELGKGLKTAVISRLLYQGLNDTNTKKKSKQ